MKNIIIGVLVIIAAAGIIINTRSRSNLTSRSLIGQDTELHVIPIEDAAEKENSDTMHQTDIIADIEKEMIIQNESEVTTKTPGKFVSIDDIDIATLDGNIVLDFSATWCPSCRTFKADVESNLDAIPSDLTLVLVDYDSNTELKQKYGITQQHTFVQIDNTGNQIQKWSGGATLSSVVSKIQ